MTLDIYTIILTLGVFLNLFFGFFILSKNLKNISAIFLFLFCLVNSLWASVSYVAIFISTETIAIFVLRSILFLAVYQTLFVYFLVKTFPKEKYVFSRVEKLFILPVYVILSGLCFTAMFFESVTNNGPVHEPTIGLLMPVFAVFTIGLIVYTLYLLFRTGKSKHLFYGLLFMFLSIIALNFITSVVFKNPYFVSLSALFTLPFVVFASYGILKDKSYDIKTITTEIFVYLYWSLTFFFVFLVEDLLLKLLVFTLLLASIFLGILIIRSVRKEIEEKERVVRLNKLIDKQRKEIEIQKSSLQELLRLKEETLHIVNHQVNTPISVIVSGAQMFKDGLWDKEKFLDIVNTQTTRMKQTIAEFMQAKKAEDGKLEIKKVTSDLATVVENIVEEKRLLKKVREDTIKIIFEKKGVIPQISFDIGKITEVVSNLLDNAINYSKQDILVSLENETKFLKLSVKDSGIGISKENVGKLFSRFTRLDNAKNTRPDGTGLGLYVCKQIIEAHGGKIWAESSGEGKGSTFMFEIPIA